MIVTRIIDYFYLGLLITCFILALGNRPQGSKWGYTTAFIGFGCITIYMTVRYFFGLQREVCGMLMSGFTGCGVCVGVQGDTTGGA